MTINWSQDNDLLRGLLDSILSKLHNWSLKAWRYHIWRFLIMNREMFWLYLCHLFIVFINNFQFILPIIKFFLGLHWSSDWLLIFIFLNQWLVTGSCCFLIVVEPFLFLADDKGFRSMARMYCEFINSCWIHYCSCFVFIDDTVRLACDIVGVNYLLIWLNSQYSREMYLNDIHMIDCVVCIWSADRRG